MALQESEFTTHLRNVLETDFAKIARLNLTVGHLQQYFTTVNQSAGNIHTYMGPQEARLELTFYFDQQERRPNVILIGELEQGMRAFCQRCGLSFQHRSMDPNTYRSDSISAIDYAFKIYDYDNFLVELHKMAHEAFDKEFTQDLEEKLSEG